jgi:hypothetical protein
MKSELLSVDEEPLQGDDTSLGFSAGSSLEGAWLLGDSDVSCPSWSVNGKQTNILLVSVLLRGRTAH